MLLFVLYMGFSVLCARRLSYFKERGGHGNLGKMKLISFELVSL
jgi:hypothetical protein